LPPGGPGEQGHGAWVAWGNFGDRTMPGSGHKQGFQGDKTVRSEAQYVIDFRYHLVSLVAVLLALATGILVGSSLLNQPLIEGLNATTDSLAREKEDLRRQLTASQDQVGYRDTFAASVSGLVVDRRLTGQRILLVTLPGASGRDVDALGQTLRQAGGTLAGRLAVEPAYFDQAKAPVLDDLTTRLALPGVEVTGDSPTARAAAQLARAVLSEGATGELEASGTALVAAFDQAGFVTRDGGLQRGGLAALVVGEPQGTSDEQRRVNAEVVALARAFDAAGSGVVLAGPLLSASDGGPLAALRGDRDSSGEVSTVDPVSSPFGRIAAVFALAEQAGGKSGQYGSTGGTDGPLPEIGGGAR